MDRRLRRFILRAILVCFILAALILFCGVVFLPLGLPGQVLTVILTALELTRPLLVGAIAFMIGLIVGIVAVWNLLKQKEERLEENLRDNLDRQRDEK